MDNKGRIDRQLFDARVAQTRTHPDFLAARYRFSTEVPDSRLHNHFRHTINADTGAFALAITVTGMNRLQKNGATVEAVVFALTAGGFASATRIRAMIDQMEDRGLIRVISDPEDKRRKRLELTDIFIAAERDWFEAVLNCVGMIFPLPDTPHNLAHGPDVLERYLTGIMLRSVMDQFTLMEGMPEIEAFMNRRHGYLLMLRLAGRDGLETEVHRTAMAEQFGVSAAHIAGMLADAEHAGWLRREQPSSRVLLDPDFAEKLDIWIARELTIVGLWIEAKFGAPAQQKPIP